MDTITSFSDFPMVLKVLFTIDMIIIGTGILLHLLGIILNISNHSEMTTQSVLLLNLSTVSLLSLATNFYAVHHKSFTIRFSRDFIMVFHIAYKAYLLNVILLTIDPLLMVFMGLRYKLEVTKTKAIISLIATWLLGIGYGILVKFTSFYKNTTSFVETESLIFNGFMIVFMTMAYQIITAKRKISAQASNAHVQNTRKMWMVPLIIVLSYLLFNFLPPLLIKRTQHLMTKTQSQHLTIGLIGVNCLNNIVEAIVHIFLKEVNRKRLMNFIQRWSALFTRNQE